MVLLNQFTFKTKDLNMKKLNLIICDLLNSIGITFNHLQKLRYFNLHIVANQIHHIS